MLVTSFGWRYAIDSRVSVVAGYWSALIAPFASIAAPAPGVMQFYARFCDAVVSNFLARGIERGSLTLRFEGGGRTSRVYGETVGKARQGGRAVASIRVRNGHDFAVRVATAADIGFAEAYMAGDFDVDHSDELVKVFFVLIENREAAALRETRLLVSWIGAKLNTLLHRLNSNTLVGSRRNIEAHYDLSNELFATFLGPTWLYSCAYFSAPNMSLDDAQHAKVDMILEKARLSSQTHVLEIGCGWGELAIRAALRYRCRVTGITLSREQCSLATRRALEAGVEELVRFELIDYRAVAQRQQRYDRIISVEMLEAVGHEFLGDYFASLDTVLRADGLVVVQVITTPESRYESYRRSTDFVQKHIFPGGLCPSLHAIVNAATARSSLSVEHVQNIGPHYAVTLREWRKRFCAAAKSGRVAEMGFDETFVRKWIYYLCYCEAGFATRTLGDLQIVLSRPRNVVTLGAPPSLCAKQC